jgi:hypothetical protein
VHRFFTSLTIIPTALLCCALGCNKDQVDKAASGLQQVTQTVQQGVENIKQEANLTGSMELSTTPAIAAKACYARLIVIGEGRPNVLQLVSYKDASLERFPSLLVQAQVQEGSLAELAGKTVQAEIFAQSEENGPVFHCPDGTLASVNISAADAKSLTGQCTGAMLVSSETNQPTSVNGKFVAVVE